MTATEPVAALTDRYGGPAPEEVLARLEQPDMADVKAVVSWRGVVVNGDVCLVDLALALPQAPAGRIVRALRALPHRRRHHARAAREAGRRADRRRETPRRTVAKIRRWPSPSSDSAWCGIANTIRDPILALLDVGEEHFAAHAAGADLRARDHPRLGDGPVPLHLPVDGRLPSYIFQGLEEHPHLATTIVKRDNPLPAIIGRTCPHPCETNCSLAPIGQPIAINNIKRWCADRAEGLADDQLRVGLPGRPDRRGAARGAVEAAGGPGRIAGGPHEVSELTTAQLSQRPVEVTCRLDDKQAACGRKVAIIGAGPAGLSAGYFLARRGYKPTIFEDLPVPGGMVHVGIPEYRLPRHVIMRETELIQQEGVEIRYNTQRRPRHLLGADLDKEFEATFVGIGAHLGRPLGIPGEDLPGAMDAIEFLRKVALHEPIDIGDDVLVLGGGNSAMDAARTAVRLGAKNVQVVYRRTRNEMPANPWEIEEAEEEGVHFQYLAAPVECKGDAERQRAGLPADGAGRARRERPAQAGPDRHGPVRAHRRQHHRRRGTEAGFRTLQRR